MTPRRHGILQHAAPAKIPDTAQAPFRDDGQELFNRISYHASPEMSLREAMGKVYGGGKDWFCEVRSPVRIAKLSAKIQELCYMALDLALAIAHHLLIFILFGILVAELILVRESMSYSEVTRIAAIDLWYGIVAILILAVGFSRAIFAAKGWDYYSSNYFFWAKIGVFALIAVISVWPTLQFIDWRRRFAGAAPQVAAGTLVKRILWLELGLFALLPAFAAAMARGYG